VAQFEAVGHLKSIVMILIIIIALSLISSSLDTAGAMPHEYSVTQWDALDTTVDPNAFVRYLDAVSSLHPLQRLKSHSYDLLHPREGRRFLDLGCGVGDDVRALAAHVGTTGRVLGIDSSNVMIAEARKRSEGLNLPMDFAVADVLRTGLPDNSFDGCRAERLFVHLANPAAALLEMVRVTKPEGCLVVLDADWQTLIVDSKRKTVTRKLFDFFCDTGNSRWIGRQLRGLFVATGLNDISIAADTLILTDLAVADTVFKLSELVKQASATGAVSVAEADSWFRELKQSDERGTFFAALTIFCIGGIKGRP
jgi:ubiquinone/menaquinone biosynthesis C-methylase UbiE